VKVITKVPGKLILLGEYGVLEGASALVATVNRFAQVTLESTEDSTFLLRAPAIDIPGMRFLIDASGKIQFLKRPLKKTAQKMQLFLSIFEYALHTLKKHGKSLVSTSILLDTSEFFYQKQSAKLGLGSSAALTVALIASLYEHVTGRPQDANKLFREALEAHRLAQGNIGSGIDVAASVYGGILCYKIEDSWPNFSAKTERLKMPSGLHYLPIWVGKSSSTIDFVKQFYKFKQLNRKHYQTLLEEMQFWSSEGCRAFKQENVPEFLESVRAYHQIMEKLGEKIGAPVISKEHQRLADISANVGAVYKPSGAGGGDLGIAFSDSENTIKRLREQIARAGFEIMDLDFGTTGIQIQHDEGKIHEDISNS